MNIYEALILGLVQGLTEFLPISSSGHLVIAKDLMGGFNEPGILFEVLLHLGTLLAVLVYFRREILEILSALIPGSGVAEAKREEGRKTALVVIVGTLPTVVIALLFKNPLERLFDNVQAVSVMLLVTGLLLFLSDRVKGGGKSAIGIKDALIIGTVQGMAIIPGISRSGSTIATGLFRGVNAERAATYSFLLSIPAICGAVVLHMKDMGNINGGQTIPYLAGMATAAMSGFFSITVLMKVVSGRKLRYFAFYCWAVGLLSLTNSLI